MRLLTDHATVVVSGTKIAEELRTSRSEVWRLVQQLRRAGVRIAGHPATGYQLQAVPDLLLPAEVAAAARGTIFDRHVVHYYKVGSTNAAAMEAASAGSPEGSVFIAEEQTAGRGRGSHTWHSARSAGLYFSVVLRPALTPSDALLLSLAAGLAVQSGVRSVAPGLEPDLKWPNDIVLGGKKFCGILTEMNAEAMRVRHVVVGIGINVNQSSFPAELDETATSLRMVSGREWSRIALMSALLKSLDREYCDLLGKVGGRESIVRRFEEHSSMARGCRVRAGDQGVEGITEGLDARGFLQVRAGRELHVVLSGSVRRL